MPRIKIPKRPQKVLSGATQRLAAIIPLLVLSAAALSAGSHVILEKFLKVRDFKAAVTQLEGMIKAQVLDWVPGVQAPRQELATRYILAMEAGLNLNGLP